MGEKMTKSIFKEIEFGNEKKETERIELKKRKNFQVCPYQRISKLIWGKNEENWFESSSTSNLLNH